MGIEAIAIGVFLFVALTVGGLRALDTLRKVPTVRKAELTSYTGPTFNRRGNELESE